MCSLFLVARWSARPGRWTTETPDELCLKRRLRRRRRHGAQAKCLDVSVDGKLVQRGDHIAARQQRGYAGKMRNPRADDPRRGAGQMCRLSRAAADVSSGDLNERSFRRFFRPPVRDRGMVSAHEGGARFMRNLARLKAVGKGPATEHHRNIDVAGSGRPHRLPSRRHPVEPHIRRLGLRAMGALTRPGKSGIARQKLSLLLDESKGVRGATTHLISRRMGRTSSISLRANGLDSILSPTRTMSGSPSCSRGRLRAWLMADGVLSDVGQGWQPPCDFLGLDVPDLPFPRSNTRAEFWTSWEENPGSSTRPRPKTTGSMSSRESRARPGQLQHAADDARGARSNRSSRPLPD